MLFHTDLIKWYLMNGLIVDNITKAVKYEKKKTFEKFKDQVSNSRRQGDLKQEYKLQGEMFKLLILKSLQWWLSKEYWELFK